MTDTVARDARQKSTGVLIIYAGKASQFKGILLLIMNFTASSDTIFGHKMDIRVENRFILVPKTLI